MPPFSKTTASSSPLPSNVHSSAHPLVQTKLSKLRMAPEAANISTLTNSSFETRQLVQQIGTIIATEALASGVFETVREGTAQTPINHSFTPATINTPIALIPILRSGLELVTPVSDLLHPTPHSIHHLGLYRDTASGRPVEYYNNFRQLPEGSQPPVAIIVDPIIATGQTMCAAIETVVEWGAKKVVIISVLGSDAGLRKVAGMKEKLGVEVDLWIGDCDPETDDKGMIVPGLGDVGDRMFGAVGK